MMSNRAKGTGPLAGVRVIDLTAMVMGPYCTQILADMGADVIKIEPPEGDGTRYISVGPVPGMGGIFVNVNRGKRSVVLDLRTDAGKAALRRLVGEADVFIHSMRAKAIAKLGFSYQEVAAINPAIVYTNCYGYGRRGPDKDLTAYDDTIQAECGLPAVQQMLTGEANYVGTILADKVSGHDRGLRHHDGVVPSRAHRRGPGGGGLHVRDHGFFHAGRACQRRHVHAPRWARRSIRAPWPRTASPTARSDGYISALIYNDKQWSTFVEAVRPPWASDPSYATLELRAKKIDTVYRLLADTFKERTTQQWLELFRSLDIPAAPLRTPDELMSNSHLNAVGFFETVDSPHGPVRFPGIPTWFSRTPGRVANAAPMLGADTQSVLKRIRTACRRATGRGQRQEGCAVRSKEKRLP